MNPATAGSLRRPGAVFGSLRARIVLSTALLVATASLMAVGLLAEGAQRHRASTEQQLAATARVLSLAVDGRVVQAQAALDALAASPSLRSGDLAAFDAQARAGLRDPDAWIVLSSQDGADLIDTRLPPGAKPPNAPFIHTRIPWDQLFKSGGAVGDLQTGDPKLPVILHVDRLVRLPGRPAYDLAMVMRPQALQPIMQSQNLPAGWFESVMDARGLIIARNREPERWVGTLAGRASVRRLRAVDRTVFETRSLDGPLTVAALDRSQLTGWVVGVAIPRYEVGEDVGKSLGMILVVAALLLALGGGLILWFARSIAHAVHTLEGVAERLGRGEAAPSVSTGLRETDFIARALSSAAAQLAAREEELQRINDTLEARVEDATARLVQAQKTEAIGRLTGGVAHDFNNLLTAVIGNLDMLKRKVTDERQLQFVQNARSAADRGAKLTAQLLAFAKRQRLVREPVEVNGVIEGMGELLTGALVAGMRLETALAPRLPLAVADRTQLEMMLLNLVINARDAMPDGGRIRIETRAARIDQPPARPESPPVGDYVCVTVSDSGMGMAPEVLERAFEPFFTTKPTGRGSGLGLPQVLGIAQQLGGGLEIQSAPGQGAQVSLFLPLADGQAQAAREPGGDEAAERSLAGGLTVLLIDDDDDVRATGAHLLRELGCRVIEADSGERALDLAPGVRPSVALIDFGMPGLNGLDTARRLRERDPGLPVLLTSGYLDAEALLRAWTGPILRKPYSGGDLARAVREALRQDAAAG